MTRGLRLRYLQSVLKIIQSAVGFGVSVDQILEGVGIDESSLADPYMTITHSQEMAIYRNIKNNSDREDIGLCLGWSMRPQDLGALGYAQKACQTVEDVIALAKSYRDLTVDYFRWDFVVTKGEVLHRIFDQEQLDDLRVFLFEIVLAMLQRSTQDLVLADAKPTCVKLSYPDPGYRSAYVELFGDNIQFDQNVTELRYPLAYMDIELPHHDVLLKSTMEQLCQSMVSRLKSELILADEIRNLLRQVEYKAPDLEGLAKDLNLSSRSLRRHLQEQGTSYRQIVDDVHRERALHYLDHTDMAIQEISDRCGFTEQRAFYSAFKRWTGLAPANYRSQDSA